MARQALAVKKPAPVVAHHLVGKPQPAPVRGKPLLRPALNFGQYLKLLAA